MGAWHQALSACQQALSIDPDFELARALLHESVEVDRTLLPDAQAVISTL
tara:strand:+ start:26 stop:175 length:150 start_codon:yes stop_codon:yes gene_type:complete